MTDGRTMTMTNSPNKMTPEQVAAIFGRLSKQPAMASVTRTVTRATKTIKTYPCDHRGAKLGEGECTCKNKPAVYACKNPNVTAGHCMLAPRSITGILWTAGGQLPIGPQQFVPVCSSCPHRLAAPVQVATATADPIPTPLRFFRTSDLHRDTSMLLQQLPEFSAAIAIPRSGMLPAAILATARHVPLYSLRHGQLLDVGAGFRAHSFRRVSAPMLLIDDTTWSGRAMQAAAASLPSKSLIRAAVYAHDRKHIDFCAVEAKQEFVVEWNLFNNPGLMRGHASITACRGGVALDFDGVLCEDPQVSDAADLPGFLRWLDRARPLHLPAATPVKLICSGRLEAWRTNTVTWMTRHGIRCDRLLLDPAATVQDRGDYAAVATRKGAEFRDSACTLFVESDRRQCPIIRDVARKPVVCLTTGEVEC